MKKILFIIVLLTLVMTLSAARPAPSPMDQIESMPACETISLVDTSAYGNSVYATFEGTDAIMPPLVETIIWWEDAEYVDYQILSSEDRDWYLYYTGNDYESPTMIFFLEMYELTPYTPYFWETSFGGDRPPSKTYGKLIFDYCYLDVEW